MAYEVHPIAKFRLSQSPPETQESLGAKIGVDGMTVSRWERGESLPQKRNWSRLEEVTGISIAKIIAAGTQSEPAA
jgi:ribosome-binding protein aMBF1 (putative translation factor)